MTDAQALAATVMEAHGKALDGATSNIPSAYRTHSRPSAPAGS